jgi:CHAT domain-containing protein
LANELPGAEAPFSSKIGIARCLLYSGHEADGIDRLKSFLAQARRMDLQIRQVNILVALLEYYNAHNILTPESANVARQCYALAAVHGLRRITLYSTTFLTKYYLASHQISSAEQYAKSTILGLRAASDVYNLPGVLWTLAGLQLAQNKLTLADGTYRESINTVDALLKEIPVSNDRNSIIAATTPIYSDYVSFLIDKLKQPERAFSLIERTKARSIDDFLAPSGQSHDANFDPRFGSRIRALTRQVYVAKRRELVNDLWETENSAIRFSSLRGVVPEAQTLSVRAVQRRLRPSEMLIVFFSSTPDSFAISVTPKTFNITKLQSALTLGRKITTLLSNVLLLRTVPDLERQLYIDLIARIPSIAEYSDLIIIPDATLNRLPFEILRDPSGHYLIENHDVSYAPSATALGLLRTHSEPSGSAFLGVGGVNYGVASRAAASAEIGPESFVNLPSTISEIFAAKNSLGAAYNTLLLGVNATEEQFRTLRLEVYRVIHFAVHGVTDDQFPEHNALVLGDLPSSREDGLLQVREIQQLRFRARLVILSSCVSTVGTAEGLAAYGSLAQAFLHAGAHSVLGTDWHVDDRMTSRLMAFFYGHLSEGMLLSKALQRAKVDVIETYGGDAPYYWAGFRIVGNGAERISE